MPLRNNEHQRIDNVSTLLYCDLISYGIHSLETVSIV